MFGPEDGEQRDRTWVDKIFNGSGRDHHEALRQMSEEDRRSINPELLKNIEDSARDYLKDDNARSPFSF